MQRIPLTYVIVQEQFINQIHANNGGVNQAECCCYLITRDDSDLELPLLPFSVQTV